MVITQPAGTSEPGVSDSNRSTGRSVVIKAPWLVEDAALIVGATV
jgi:hypothetical protein